MDIDELPDLEKDMSDSPIIVSYLKDKTFAIEFYQALCNMQWEKIDKRSEDLRIIDKLRGINPDIWSVTWRGSGQLIANIRNKNYNTKEDYMHYYCSGQEGNVSPLVEKCFKELGWKKRPWEDDGL
jgi:hypothetical protein